MILNWVNEQQMALILQFFSHAFMNTNVNELKMFGVLEKNGNN